MNTAHLFRRLGGFFLVVLFTATAAAFEGKVDMKVTAGPKDKDAMEMSYRIKGERMRMDFGGAESSSKKKKKKSDATGAVIMDFKKKEMIMMMDEEKMYMVHALPEPGADDGRKKKGDEELKATGRKEKIAGIDAEEYAGRSDGRIIEVWGTKEMGRYMSQQSSSGKGGAGWEAFMQKENMFPLRTITRKKADGPEESRMEVVAVDRSKQADSLFAPPGDYQKMEMPSMPGMGDMLKGMIPGR